MAHTNEHNTDQTLTFESRPAEIFEGDIQRGAQVMQGKLMNPNPPSVSTNPAAHNAQAQQSASVSNGADAPVATSGTGE